MWQYLIIQSCSVRETLECQISHAGVTPGTSALLCLYFTPLNMVDDGFMSCLLSLSLFILTEQIACETSGSLSTIFPYFSTPPYATLSNILVYSVNYLTEEICAFREPSWVVDLTSQEDYGNDQHLCPVLW